MSEHCWALDVLCTFASYYFKTIILSPTQKFQNMSKKLFLLPVLMLVLAAGALTTSCNKDCETKQSNFTGTYLASESCSISGTGSYSVQVSEGAADNEILFTNFNDFYNNTVKATIDCDNVTISSQDPDSDNYIVEGSGTRTKDGDRVTLSINFSITGENNQGQVVTNTCDVTLTK